MIVFKLFFFFVAIIALSQTCSHFQCKICPFDQIDKVYLETLSIYALNRGVENLKKDCVPKNISFIKRKILVYNSNRTNLTLDSNSYDFYYENLAHAFTSESKILVFAQKSELDIIVSVGFHEISEKDLLFVNSQFFRTIAVNLTIMSISNEPAYILIKTNKFYVFIGSELKILNIIFLGNDINEDIDSDCRSHENSICCDLSFVYEENMGSSLNFCDLKNFPLEKINKMDYYGMFNLENIFIENTNSSPPIVKIINCSFLNFSPLKKEGFLILISMAPVTGNLLMENVQMNNSFFPFGLLYYSLYNYDQLFSIIPVEIISSQNLNNTVVLNGVRVSNYNLNNFGKNNNVHYFLMRFFSFSGKISIMKSYFDTINYMNPILQLYEVNYFEILNSKLENISNSSIFSSIFSNCTKFSNLILVKISNKNNNLFYIENSSYFIINGSKINEITLSNDSSCFFIQNSFTLFEKLLVIDCKFGTFINQKGIILNIANSSLLNISFNYNLISLAGAAGAIINKTSFERITGNVYLFYASDIDYFVISEVLLGNLNLYTIMLIFGSRINFNEKLVLKNSYFLYFWEKDCVCQNIMTKNSFLTNNTIAISLIRSLSFQKLFFTLSSFFLMENNFTQINAGGIAQMQTGNCLFEKTLIINNFFLNADAFAFLFEISIAGELFVNDSLIIDSGVISKKQKYMAFSDNVFFSFWNTPYSFFNHTLMMTTDKIELLAGFISAAPYGGIFEFMNSVLIFSVKNQVFSYKGMILDHFSRATFINNTFFNLKCNNKSFSTSFGGICLLASTKFSFNKGQNNYIVKMQNNIFFNSSCINGGALAIIAIKEILIENCSFFQSKTEQKGGAFLIIGSENCTLKNIMISLSEAKQGGIAFLQNIFLLFIENLQGISSGSELNGGAFVVRYVKNCTFSKLYLKNIISGQMGGAFFIVRSTVFLQDSAIIQNSAEIKGGVLFCDDRANVFVDNILIDTCFSENGGVFSIYNSENISFNHIFVKNSFANIHGAAFLLEHFLTAQLEDIYLINNTCINGLGIIFIEETNDNSHISINDIFCLGNSAIDGSCISFFASCQMKLRNISIINSKNTAISIIGLIFVEVNTESIYFYNSTSITNIFSIQNIGLNAFNISFFNNLVSSYKDILFVFEANIRISQIIFKNNSNFRLISIDNSAADFNLMEIYKQYIDVVFAFATNSQIIIANSNFTEGIIKNSSQTSLFYFVNSNFSLEHSYFYNNLAAIFIFENCYTIYIEKSYFYNNTGLSTLLPNDILVKNSIDLLSNISIIKSQFEIFSGYSCKFEEMYHINLSQTIFTGKNLLFNELVAYAVMFINNFQIFILENLFSEFTESAIFVKNLLIIKISKIFINKSRFLKNIAKKGSALDLEGNIQIFLTDSIFSNNLAMKTNKNDSKILQGIGGCIFFNPFSYTDNSSFTIKSTQFINNSANYLAPTIFSQIPVKLDDNLSFLNNSDAFNFSQNIFSYPIKVNTLHIESLEKQLENHTNVIECTSGSPIRIIFELTDNFDQRLAFDDSSVLNIKREISSYINNVNLTISIENYLNTSDKGVVYFNDLVIKATPNTSFSLSISGKFLGLSGNLLKQEISKEILFFSRICMKGEIILPDASCRICPPGTFSFQDPMKTDLKYQKCEKCSSNCECFGGDSLLPLPGYYRYSNDSKHVVACINEQVCLGFVNNSNYSIETLIHGECLEGNHGNLCSKCNKFYGKYENHDICKPCGSLGSMIILRALLYIFLLSIYLFVNSHLAENYNVEKGASNAEIYLKISLNHLQQNNILLNTANLPFMELRKLISVSNYFSFTNDEVFTNECIMEQLFGDSYEISSLKGFKILLNSIMPIILAFFAYFLWVCLIIFKKYVKSKISKKNNEKKENFKTFFYSSKLLLFLVLSIFIFYPLIINSSFGIFECILIDPDNELYFVKMNLDIGCLGPDHIRYILFFALPGLVLFGIGFPFYMSWALKQFVKTSTDNKKMSIYSPENLVNLNKSHKNNKLKPFGFFYKGFKNSFFYWECLILLRKMLLCFVSILNKSSAIEYKWNLFIYIFFLFLIYTMKYEPYKMQEANLLEIFSLVCCIFTCLGCFIFSMQINENLKFGVFGLGVLLHSCFFVKIIVNFMKIIVFQIKRYRNSRVDRTVNVSNFQGKQSVAITHKFKNKKNEIN